MFSSKDIIDINLRNQYMDILRGIAILLVLIFAKCCIFSNPLQMKYLQGV
jgi:hypothetical protein